MFITGGPPEMNLPSRKQSNSLVNMAFHISVKKNTTLFIDVCMAALA
jgi:hypothetical protein